MRVLSMIFLAAAVVVVAPRLAQAEVITKKNASIHFIEDARVPAQEEGLLKQVFAQDGQQVEAGTVLAQIDDKLVTLQHQVANAELEVARRRSQDEISIKYARRAATVYKADYGRMREANKKFHGTFPETDIELARLKWDQFDLQAEKSEFEKGIAELEMKVSEAKMAAAIEHIERSKIRAPWKGVIDRVFHHTGDWVKPGDPILRMIRTDVLRVTCSLDALKYTPADVKDRPVTVTVTLPGGAEEVFTGRITNCSPVIGHSGEFQVWTDLANRERNGELVLRDGRWATMAIELN
ncbi:MAG: HlyD family efflux transporter periplasmic adaptor subunit [Pirellulales bacterium]|nr:HlyD family efflux transporter periplasmic adaptor subunit [Pirellulales bacterium]